MNVREKLLKVQTELKAPKSQYNSFGKYNYRSCEDILESVKKILQDVKATVTISDDIVMLGDRYYVKATATFTDAENLDEIQNVAYAREEDSKKGMDASQVTGSTSSYARKYALNGLFCIDDTKDADSLPPNSNSKKASSTNVNDELTAVKKEIISYCTQVGGTKNQNLMQVLKSYVASGNPNGIRSIEKAKECLEKVKTIKPVTE